MGVGLRLKELLRQKKMTIKQLSELSGVSLNTLYSITKRDSEKIDPVILDKIVTALNSPENTLVLEENNAKDIDARKMADHLFLRYRNLDQHIIDNLVQLFCSLSESQLENILTGIKELSNARANSPNQTSYKVKNGDVSLTLQIGEQIKKAPDATNIQD